LFLFCMVFSNNGGCIDWWKCPRGASLVFSLKS
jgi:hypothetical protein